MRKGDCPHFIVNFPRHPACLDDSGSRGPATPRQRRFAPAGVSFHVLNRGNDRRRIFFEDADYRSFLSLLARGKQLYPVRIFGVCLMPNHFHGLMSPETEGALSSYLQWVQGRYACDLRSLTRTVGQGHIFQRRFWSDGIEDARHFFAVLRYIEANPVRARLVERAEQWMWSSLVLRTIEVDQVLDPLPYLLPERWVDVVNEVQPITEVEHIRNPAERGRPTQACPMTPRRVQRLPNVGGFFNEG